MLNGCPVGQIKGEILTSASFNDYNSFDAADRISTKGYKKFKKENDNGIYVELPPLSVVMLEVR